MGAVCDGQLRADPGPAGQGQLCSGDFAASKSKTFPVPVAVLFAAFAEGRREAWMGEATAVRTVKENHAMRLTWPDGTVAAFRFTDKGDRSTVSVQHSALASIERRDAEKLAWGERFSRLQAALSEG